MASDDPVKEQSPQQLDLARLQDGPYVLRTLLQDVPLSADGPATDVKINCVEYFDHNLYVGTSASELLHFVQIPPDPSDPSGRPTFILASRLQPPFAETNNTKPGVQQILLLPRVSKACILLQLDHDPNSRRSGDDIAVLNRRIQVVRIGDDPRAIKEPRCRRSTISVRRDTIACVADAGANSLLDVTRQLKIPLMTISSLDDSQPGGEIGQAQNIAGSVEGGILRSVSAVQNRPLQAAQAQGHSRSTSARGTASFRARCTSEAQARFLKPHIPGIGLFVSLDGDPTRPTVEFERYPREVVVDGGSSDLASSQVSPSDAEEGYLLASMAREPDTSKFWLEAESIPGIEQASVTLGIRSMIGEEETHFSEIVDRICQRKFSPFSLGSLEPSTLSLKSADSRTASSLERVSRERELFDRDNDTQSEESLPDGWQSSRNAEEEAFVARFAKTQSRVAVWAGNHIWWAVHELEFVTFSYIRQRAAVLLFGDLLQPSDDSFSDGEVKALEEIIESKRGRGSLVASRRLLSSICEATPLIEVSTPSGAWMLASFNSCAGSWDHGEKKKDFGSSPDKDEVLRSVDAALLIVLLELDRDSPRGIARSSTTIRGRTERSCGQGRRLLRSGCVITRILPPTFVLSRLYQSRKMAGDVLAVWRRIIEGERDDGGELRDGRAASPRISYEDQQPGARARVWPLAGQPQPQTGCPGLRGGQGRAPKFEPTTVVALLRAEAPAAVKYYLEHLVFGKGHTGYVNDLITYYLDIVNWRIAFLANSREAFAATMMKYGRAVCGCCNSWAAQKTTMPPRSAPASSLCPASCLFPRSSSSTGRERRHEDAIRLLVHKLGDYDTAVSYCLRGGSSIYTPLSRGRKDSMPTHEMQARLFRAVLGEFLTIADVSERVEQTGALLERFGGWFEIDDILGLIPDGWSVDIVAGFLVRALRRLVQEKHESSVMKALSSAENLRVNHELIVRIDERGPTNEAAQ
ncbi:hypothetical protein EV126DRAFT_489507 [Verticillium dahliae]|nr:hypothetical protein EV126DRAFT_489507 [Verticillium dahliae]